MAGDKVNPISTGIPAYDNSFIPYITSNGKSKLAFYKGEKMSSYRGAYKSRALTPGQQQYTNAYAQQYPDIANIFKNKKTGNLNQNGLFAYIQNMKKVHGVLSCPS